MKRYTMYNIINVIFLNTSNPDRKTKWTVYSGDVTTALPPSLQQLLPGS
jgi:hypothetical protein